MRNFFLKFAILFGVAFFTMQSATVQATDDPDKVNKERAVALVKKGIALVKEKGVEFAYPTLSDKNGPYVDKELYLFIFDHKGMTMAHGGNPKLVGKDLNDLKDMDGKRFVRDFIDLAEKNKGKGGWIDYKWLNPVSKALEQKSSYVELLPDGTVIGCGIYKAVKPN